MKTTILARFKAGLGQYNNVRNSFGDRINKLTREGDGTSYLTDYGSGFQVSDPAATAAGGVPTYQDYLKRQRGRK